MKRTLTIEIEKMVYGGPGMGRAGGKIVFVPFTAPGDRVEVQVVREKKDYVEAALKEVEAGSPLRVNPFCPYFGECGGCQYQHLSYPAQLRVKEEVVKDILRRLTRKGDFEILPIIPSPQDREYRIRSQLKAGMIGEKEVLGFYAWRTHRVVKIQECPLLHPFANRILGGLQGWLSWRTGPHLKGADFQVSPGEGQGVICLKIEGPIDPKMGEEICRNIPGIKGLVLEGKERVSQGELTLRYEWPEVCGGRKLTVHTSGESFFQVNPDQNRNLMQKVVEWAGLTGRERVLDLFCGSGNLTLPLAQKAGKVWGVDQDRLAVDQAAGNARANQLSNCIFLAAGAVEGIRRVGREARVVELVVLDPPRAGAREVLDLLASLGPRKIIYVSCEPPTLGRDLARLMALGYNVERVQPLDMFPQTYHIEVITELSAFTDCSQIT